MKIQYFNAADIECTVFCYRPQTKFGARYYFYTSLSFCSQGGGLPDQVPPLDQVHPPRPGTPPRTRYTPWDKVHPPGPVTPYILAGTPPRTRYTPRDQVHPPGASYPLPLAGTPPQTRYTPGTRYTPLAGTPPGPGTAPRPGTPPWQVHPPDGRCAGGTHPTGMHSCFVLFFVVWVFLKISATFD